jgi:endonuclease/exonuclease/phosphatase family metal-dependent hydrolase
VSLTSLAATILLSTTLTTGVIDPAAGPPPAEPAAATAEPAPIEVSVLTYNVRGLPWPVAAGRAKALAAIGRELAEMRRQGRAPRIVLIQEGFGDVGPLVRQAGYRYWSSGPGRREKAGPSIDGFARVRFPASGEGWGKLASSGLHILSEDPVTRVERIAFAHCAGFDCLANKGAMLVNIAVPGIAGGLDVVNTHMNSRAASRTPWPRSLMAHQLQTEELNRFVAGARTRGAPLLVGGDFNVKNAPDRYYYRAGERPFVVVSEYCKATSAGCQSGSLLEAPEPWLASQDLQAFAPGRTMTVRPTVLTKLFGEGQRLSDHDGLMVSYSLQAAAAIGRIAGLR